jgi:hypothetical protein
MYICQTPTPPSQCFIPISADAKTVSTLFGGSGGECISIMTIIHMILAWIVGFSCTAAGR